MLANLSFADCGALSHRYADGGSRPDLYRAVAASGELPSPLRFHRRRIHDKRGREPGEPSGAAAGRVAVASGNSGFVRQSSSNGGDTRITASGRDDKRPMKARAAGCEG